MIDVQDQFFAQASEIRQEPDALASRSTLVRNSKVLVGLSFLGSIVAFFIAVYTSLLALSFIFPLHAVNLDRFAAACLWAFFASIMAASQVVLWRQARVMANCLVLLDSRGAHFKLDGTKASKELFLPWSGIAAVRQKRTPDGQKFIVLGTDTRIVTFTSYSFYRPKKVARMIAAHAGVPLITG